MNFDLAEIAMTKSADNLVDVNSLHAHDKQRDNDDTAMRIVPKLVLVPCPADARPRVQP